MNYLEYQWHMWGLGVASQLGMGEGEEGGEKTIDSMFLPNPKAIPFKTFPDRVLLLRHSFCSFILYLFLYLREILFRKVLKTEKKMAK